MSAPEETPDRIVGAPGAEADFVDGLLAHINDEISVSPEPIEIETDLLLTAPTSLSRLVADRFDLVVLEPPIPLPTHGVGMLWHERFTKEPAHAWLRGVLKQLTA